MTFVYIFENQPTKLTKAPKVQTHTHIMGAMNACMRYILTIHNSMAFYGIRHCVCVCVLGLGETIYELIKNAELDNVQNWNGLSNWKWPIVYIIIIIIEKVINPNFFFVVLIANYVYMVCTFYYVNMFTIIFTRLWWY